MIAAALAVIVAIGPSPAPARGTTVTAAALSAQLISLINNQRKARGLASYRTDARLNVIAAERATRMAESGILSHAAAGPSLSGTLTSRGIQWYGYGEVIGWSGYPWGSQAASHLVSMWMASSSHRPLLVNTKYNYVGAGLAYRSANGTTWASVVFTESLDQSRPVASTVAISRSGSRVSYRWTGVDGHLQSHTAGLRSFDVQYRVDSAAWRTIRNDTTSTSLSISGRPSGHWYGFRVQAADRRGNLSAWTTEARIWVP